MEEVMNKMQDTFTSNEFFKVAQEMGHSIRILDNGKAIGFLLSKGCQRLSKKTWRKPKEFQIESGGDYERAQQAPQTEQQCIDFLKRTGKYKIMKITMQEI